MASNIDLARHAEILSELLPPECDALYRFCMGRMEFGAKKYAGTDLAKRDIITESREELADAINRIAMKIAEREPFGMPIADLVAAKEYILRAYELLR